jgi:hypothetical protein
VKPSIVALELASELADLGLSTVVLSTRGHQRHPCVRVDSGTERRVSVVRYIYVAPDDEGALCFWLEEPLEVIAPAEHVSVAADIIAADQRADSARE